MLRLLAEGLIGSEGQTDRVCHSVELKGATGFICPFRNL